MLLNNADLERLELRYFEQISYRIGDNHTVLVEALKSKDLIAEDWLGLFKNENKSRESSDMARGAERVFFYILGDKIGRPNSCPIGADLFFETHDAFIHIDVKTARTDNPSDYKGLVPTSKNQTSYKPQKTYSGTDVDFQPNLPQYYSNGFPCLTYSIQVIYDAEDYEVIAILLFCIPNGQLYRVYRDTIVGAGKIKDGSFRYKYSKNPYFSTISEEKLRICLLYYNDEKGNPTKKEITDGIIDNGEGAIITKKLEW